MGLAAAGGGHTGLAILALGACAVVSVLGLLIFESTVHRDHMDHHETPHLLCDSYVPPPQWVHRGRGRDSTRDERA